MVYNIRQAKGDLKVKINGIMGSVIKVAHDIIRDIIQEESFLMFWWYVYYNSQWSCMHELCE